MIVLLLADMSVPELEIAVSVTNANIAAGLMDSALSDFNAQCRLYNWVEVEKARLRVVSHMESYLDKIAEVYRLLGQN